MLNFIFCDDDDDDESIMYILAAEIECDFYFTKRGNHLDIPKRTAGWAPVSLPV